MKIKNGFILKEICDSYMVIAVGAQTLDFQGMIRLNESGAFLWKLLTEDTTREQLITALLEEYDVNKETAACDVDEFLTSLTKADLLE